jgi:hypothetical protein
MEKEEEHDLEEAKLSLKHACKRYYKEESKGALSDLECALEIYNKIKK